MFQPQSEFTFLPNEGEIKPLEEVTLFARFTPLQCRSVRTLFELRVADGTERYGISLLSSFLAEDCQVLLSFKQTAEIASWVTDLFPTFFSALSVRAEVQTPVACLLSCELHIEDVFLQVPLKQSFTLCNQTMLPTKYEWGQVSLQLCADSTNHNQAQMTVC